MISKDLRLILASHQLRHVCLASPSNPVTGFGLLNRMRGEWGVSLSANDPDACGWV